MEPIYIHTSKRHAILLLLGCSVFVGIGTWMVLSDHSQKAQIVGWANILFFGLGFPISIKLLFENKPRIILTDEGITDTTLKVGLIEWADIVGCHVYNIYGTSFIGLELLDENKYLERLPAAAQGVSRANEAFGFQRFCLNLGSISMDPVELANLILQKAAQNGQQ